jgi:putative ABC transport system ATP-binding protein
MENGSLAVSGLRFCFPGQPADLLRIDHLALTPGQTLGIRGASGAGKSTLLHCLAGIESGHSGSIHWGGKDICSLAPADLTRWRAQRLGLVFQDFHLVEGLSALGNVLLPASFTGWRATPAQRRRAALLLDRVGIVAPQRRAELLSRGERQRVAVARALLFEPKVVLADEPTASLDPENRRIISALLLDLVRENGATLIVISHDNALLSRLDRQLELRCGALHQMALTDV